jgi:hypothetical protein
MATGRETLHTIIDAEAQWAAQNGKEPQVMKLPVLMAYDLAKCSRDDLGDLSGRIFKDGITVLEKEGLHGIKVQIIREPEAALAFE